MTEMKQEYSTEELCSQISALRNLFEDVQLVDPYNAAVLDPATMERTGAAGTMPPLDDRGRAMREERSGEQTSLVIYQAITVRTRPLLLVITAAVPQRRVCDPREAAALDRWRTRVQEDLMHDFVTGVYNRRYLDEVYRQFAAQKAAAHPVSVVLARVNEYAALCRTESAVAADRCLTTAAGILQLCVGADAEKGVLARLGDGVFAAVAVDRPADALEHELRAALDSSRREFGLSLSRRGTFTVSLAGADWAETGGWDMLLALAQQRLDMF